MKIIEIVNVSDDEAKAYLYYQGMPKSLADKHVGGRLIHLQQAMATYVVNPNLNEDEQYKEIVDVLYGRYVSAALKYLESSSICRAIIEYISNGNNGEVIPVVMQRVLKGKDNDDEAILNAVDQLVKANVLRYTHGGHLAFHSKLIHSYVTKTN